MMKLFPVSPAIPSFPTSGGLIQVPAL